MAEHHPNQDWIEAYKELCEIIKANVPEIKHIDLWADQFYNEEYPYPDRSLFIEFFSNEIQTTGEKTQDLIMQIRFILCYQTLSDSFDGSDNQNVALGFGEILRKIHACLQGTYGQNFSAMTRVNLQRVEAPMSCISYSQTYACIVRDYAPVKKGELLNLHEQGVAPAVEPTYDVNV